MMFNAFYGGHVGEVNLPIAAKQQSRGLKSQEGRSCLVKADLVH